MPLPLALLSALGPAIQAGLGITQGIKGRQLGKGDRPLMEVPPAIRAMLGLAEGQASQTGIPGQSAIEQQISAATAGGVGQLERVGGPGLQGAASDLVRSEQDALVKLGVAGSEFKNDAINRLMNVQGVVGGFEQKAFETNELQPYLDEMRKAESLKDASIRNLVGGVTGGIGSFLGTQNQMDELDILKSIYGKSIGKEGGTEGTKTADQFNFRTEDFFDFYDGAGGSFNNAPNVSPDFMSTSNFINA